MITKNHCIWCFHIKDSHKEAGNYVPDLDGKLVRKFNCIECDDFPFDNIHIRCPGFKPVKVPALFNGDDGIMGFFKNNE